MKHVLNKDFLSICYKILAEGKTLEEWVVIESDDQFHEGNYTGGFDSTEMEFTFSVMIDYNEYWFQMPLSAIEQVLNQVIREVQVVPAER